MRALSPFSHLPRLLDLYELVRLDVVQHRHDEHRRIKPPQALRLLAHKRHRIADLIALCIAVEVRSRGVKGPAAVFGQSADKGRPHLGDVRHPAVRMGEQGYNGDATDRYCIGYFEFAVTEV